MQKTDDINGTCILNASRLITLFEVNLILEFISSAKSLFILLNARRNKTLNPGEIQSRRANHAPTLKQTRLVSCTPGKLLLLMSVF